MKKRSVKQISSLIVASFALALLTNNYVSASQVKREGFLLDGEGVSNSWQYYNPKDLVIDIDLSVAEQNNFSGKAQETHGLRLAVEQGCDINLNIPVFGEYWILAEYEPININLFENLVNIKVNEQSYVCSLPFIWEDEISEEIKKDRYNNEIIPQQNQIKASTYTYLEDYKGFSRTPIPFNFQKGAQVLTLQAQNQDILLKSIKLIKPSVDLDYEKYEQQYTDTAKFDGIITIEGEGYRAKSDSFIRGRNVQNTSVYPSDTYSKRINATDDKSNKIMGQKLMYEMDAPKDGIYYLSIKYSQPLKIGGASYRTIEIDGSTPFAQARNMQFVHTGIDIYGNTTLGGKQPIGIYLSKGVHTLTLKTTAQPMEAIYNELLSIVNEINDTGIQMKRIKGGNADDTAAVDKNRTWDILQYMPTILDDLHGWQDRLQIIYQQLYKITGEQPSFASDISLAAQNLERLAAKPREIPNKMSLLSDDPSSAAQLIALTLTKIYDQNLSIDSIYLHGINTKLPSPSSNFFSELATGVKQFIHSFSPNMNESVDVKTSGGALTVWINKPAQYVEALRELTAQTFTRQTGIDVVYSIMPDEKKITLANSSGTNPDIALGLAYYRPAEFAMRGMAKNLLAYEDFLEWYSQEYNIEALAPMAYEDGIYGASETQDFNVLFYRRDIIDALDINVPNTWEDVKQMMPTLHRNAMNFNLPLANNVAYKSFETTGCFIFQNNGDYYSQDGFSSNFKEPNTLTGLKEMTDLYRVYGLAQNVPNFFNAFRSGTVPIGVSNFSTYLQLQMAAPELTGRWDIALVPGTMQSDGSISRYYSANATTAMIFDNTLKSDESYKFLKWWLSSDTQIKYATGLQMKYGPDYVWNTANHKAFEQMSYPRLHKQIILEQWQWQMEALRHPASYILEREVSNAFIDIVTKGVAFQPRIDKATLAADREMKRKLTEFNYYDEQGIKLRNYNINLISELKQKLLKKEAS